MIPKKVKKINELKVLQDLFNAVTENDILFQPKGSKDLYYRGKKLSPEIRAKMISDANLLKTMDLWSILLDCMKYEANKKIFNEAIDGDSLIFPKAMLYTVDIFQKKVDNLSQLT